MSARPWRILLADADRASLRQISKLLGILGYETATAADAETALAALDAVRPDFLLLDARLSPEGSRELCREARNRSQAGYLYIFFLVGHAAAEDLLEAVETGADDFLVKPVIFGELMSRLRAGSRTIEFERRIREQARFDPLTGLANRRAFEQRVRQELSSPSHPGRGQAIVLLQIDSLQRIGYQRGGPAQDDLLRAVAARLGAYCTDGEPLAHFGGGKFACLLAGKTEAPAASWAEKLRAALVAEELPFGGAPVRLTVSLGVAGGDADSPQELLERAEQALQLAQQSGGNCVLHPAALTGEARAWNNLAAPGKLFDGTLARHVMAPCTMTLQLADPAAKAAALLGQTRWSLLPVVQTDGTLAGVVTESWLASVTDWAALASQPVSDVMRSDVAQAEESAGFAELMDVFLKDAQSSIVVVDGDRPTGLITRSNLAAFSEKLTTSSFTAVTAPADHSGYFLVPESVVK